LLAGVILLVRVALVANAQPLRLQITRTNGQTATLSWTPLPLTTNPPISFRAYQLQVSSNLVTWSNFGPSVLSSLSDLGTPQQTIYVTNGSQFFRLSSQAFSSAPGPLVVSPPGTTGSGSLTLRGTAGPGFSIRVDGGAQTATGLAGLDGSFSLSVLLQPNRLN